MTSSSDNQPNYKVIKDFQVGSIVCSQATDSVLSLSSSESPSEIMVPTQQQTKHINAKDATVKTGSH